jgi:hypothetical protein
MAQGYSEAVNSRIIPYPDPTGTDARMVDMTIGGVEYTFDWATEIPITIVSGIYTFIIGQWGYVEFSYDDTDVADNPADAITITPLTITQFRVANPDGSVISPQRGPVDFNVTGETLSTDVTPPTVVSVSPSGTLVATDSNITILADETVAVGTGNYYIKEGTTTVETIAAASATYLDRTITINPVSDFSTATTVHIEWDAGVFEDIAGNGVAANSSSTYSWTTIAGGGSNPGNATADIVVSSAAGARAQLLAWEADWNGTVIPGKTAADERVLGIDASTTGTLNLSGLTFPQRVWVRHIGTYNDDYTCSVHHTGNVTLQNSTNVVAYLMDIRADASSTYSLGYITWSGTTDCGFIRCTLSGVPFDPQVTNYGSTAGCMTPTGTTNSILKNCVYRFHGVYFWKCFGTNTNFLVEGNMGLYTGGDEFVVATNAHPVGHVHQFNYADRHHAFNPSYHNDYWQQNTNSYNSNTTWLNNVIYRGAWTNVSTGAENGWQCYFTTASVKGSEVGPWLHENEIILNGHQTGIEWVAGTGTRTSRYITCLDSDTSAGQTANTRYPTIRGQDAATTERNLVSTIGTGFQTSEGTNGVKLTISASNHTPYLTYLTNIPTELTDLWDIRPVVGSRAHPDYTPSNMRVGAFDVFERLNAKDPQQLLSMVGWPVATLFIADFDTNNNWGSTYTGVFDADGNNL